MEAFEAGFAEACGQAVFSARDGRARPVTGNAHSRKNGRSRSHTSRRHPTWQPMVGRPIGQKRHAHDFWSSGISSSSNAILLLAERSARPGQGKRKRGRMKPLRRDAGGTLELIGNATNVTGSRLTSSATPSGSICASRSATVTSRNSWPNARWTFRMSRRCVLKFGPAFARNLGVVAGCLLAVRKRTQARALLLADGSRNRTARMKGAARWRIERTGNFARGTCSRARASPRRRPWDGLERHCHGNADGCWQRR